MKQQPILTYMLVTLFIGLKLTGHIEWSWIWVLSPLWIAWAVTFGVAFIRSAVSAYRIAASAGFRRR